MPQVRVNVRTLANVKAAKKAKRNNRDVWVVPSATMPDNIIMNGIKYPAEEIGKSYATLNRTPAPLGHPMINGKFVSASDPEGINIGYIGAWNENVRREGGRVFLDKIIDIEVANRSEGGKAVLNAIEKGEPVHTSTGLLAMLETVNAEDHKHIARELVFDHDAILLNEQGAATPGQGVGMFVNAQGQEEEVQVINSSMSDMADQEIDWAGTRLVEVLRRKQDAGVWEKVKSAVMEALGYTEREPSTNTKEHDMSVSDEQFKALSDEVKTLSEGVANIGKTIAEAVGNAVKPITDNLAEIQANQKAKDDAELNELREKIVKANVLDEDGAKELTLNAARGLAKNIKPAAAAAMNSAFKPSSDKGNGFQLPKGE